MANPNLASAHTESPEGYSKPFWEAGSGRKRRDVLGDCRGARQL